MSIFDAMRSDSRAKLSASRSVNFMSAWAAARAYGPPLPIAASPSSGSITSPVPLMTSNCSAVPTTSSASKRRSARSCRQSFANSTAARVRLSLNSLSFPSNFSSRVIPSAADPAKPAMIFPPAIRRTLRAPCFITYLSNVTCPSTVSVFPSPDHTGRALERLHPLASCALGDGRHRGTCTSSGIPLRDARQGSFGQRQATRPLVPDLPTLERREEGPGYVCRLEVRAGRVLEMRDERAVGGLRGDGDRLQSGDDPCGCARRDEPARRRLDVAFGTGDLSGEPDRRMSPQTQIRGQQAGTVDERVAVHHAEAKPLGALQARQLPERFSLRAPGKPCLKTDQVQRGPGRVLLPQLHDRVGDRPRPRIA